jgi:hypothetical protein
MGGDTDSLKTISIPGDFRYGVEVALGDPLPPKRKSVV